MAKTKGILFLLIFYSFFLLDISLCEEVAENELPYQHHITWESVWVGTGRIDRETMSLDIPREYAETPNAVHHLQHIRQRRKIYGIDDRVRVDPATDGSHVPYNAIVRISTGCSGILVSEKHVLAASHCVHNGRTYLLSARLFLRVGYLLNDGRTKWTFVKRFFVPAKWRNYTHTGQHEYNDWADYDFSVLELSENLGRTRHFIPPGLSGMFCNNQKTLHGVGSNVDYVSFPDDKPKDAMWLVSTKIKTETPHLLYFEGDAWHGSSGAALYTWDYNKQTGKQERRVIGVLSGNRDTEPEAKLQGNYNVAARLDPIDFLMICRWIGIENQCRDRYRDYLKEDRLKSIICNPR